MSSALYSPVPRITRDEIELKAEELLTWFNPRLLQEPSLTPMAQIAERLSDEFGVKFIFTTPLGMSPRGKKILGACQFSPRAIYIDPILLSRGPRFNFTLAHEIGHLILHRKLNLDYDGLDTPAGNIQDSRSHIHLSRRIPKTQRGWLEWQADTFAAALLIPRSTLRYAIAEKQAELGITRRLGVIYLDNQPTNRTAHRWIINHLLFVYQTSRTVANIRLKHLSLIEDHSFFSSTHISRLLRED